MVNRCFCVNDVTNLNQLDLLALSNLAKCNKRFKSLIHAEFNCVYRDAIDVQLGVSPWLSLIDLKEILREFGPYAKDLKLKSDESLEVLSVDYTTSFVCNLITQHLDPNRLSSLSIEIWPLKTKNIEEFQATLNSYRNLEKLTLNIRIKIRERGYGNEYDDLAGKLPNLKSLSVTGAVDTTQIIGSFWSTLSELRVHNRYGSIDDSMQSRLKLIPHIKQLTLPVNNEFMDELIVLAYHKSLTELSIHDQECMPERLYPLHKNIALFQLLENLKIKTGLFHPTVASARIIAKLINLKTLILVRRRGWPYRHDRNLEWEFLQILAKKLTNLKYVKIAGFIIKESDWEKSVVLLPGAKCIYDSVQCW